VAVLDPLDRQIPEQERLLSAGCTCFALLQAAQSMGFGASWLTGWPAYDPEVHALLGMSAHERVAGFVHIGTPTAEGPARQRPDPRALLTDLVLCTRSGVRRGPAGRCTWWTPASTWSAHGTRCRTSSATSMASPATRSRASPASCSNCSSA